MTYKRSKLLDFIHQAKSNFITSPWNDFLDMDVQVLGERQLQQKLHELKHPEFIGDQSQWPSLYLSTKDFSSSPYHQTIQFNRVEAEGVRYQTLTIDAHRLFNLKAIQPDPNRALNDWMVLRALDEPYVSGTLTLDEDVWMLDAPSEQATIDPLAHKAHGHVLTFGLGIGYFLFMAAINPRVTSLTVIEHNPRLIDLFKTHILPQFKSLTPITIIEGEAQAFFTPHTLKKFDYTFVDVYQSSDDGLAMMNQLLEQANPAYESLDFWIESSCTHVLPALILYAFEAYINHTMIHHPNPLYQELHLKLQKIVDFATIREVDQLKQTMYDGRLHRAILAQRLF